MKFTAMTGLFTSPKVRGATITYPAEASESAEKNRRSKAPGPHPSEKPDKPKQRPPFHESCRSIRKLLAK